MRITRQVVVFDTADLTSESRFWAGLLSGTVEADDDWHTVYVDGEPRLAFQLVPDHTGPDWPNGAQQQAHLDLFVDDVKAAHGRAMSLGARLLKPAADIGSAQGYQVYADPAGHPFCLCWACPELGYAPGCGPNPNGSGRQRPRRWPRARGQAGARALRGPLPKPPWAPRVTRGARPTSPRTL